MKTNVPNDSLKGQRFPDTEVNLVKMIDVIDLAQARDGNDDYVSELDVHMEALRSLNPNCYTLKQYDRFKSAAARTIQSILISCHARLTQYSGTAVRKCLDKKGFDIASLATNKKRALFIVTSDVDSTYSGIVNLLIMQILATLISEANHRPNGELERPVQIILDELFSIGRIVQLPKCCATVRSRNISLIMATQSISQIDDLYGSAARTGILNNCDTLVYLGGGDSELRKYMEQEIYPIVDEELYSVGAGDCIVKTRNELAFKANKYNQEDHPLYKEMCDLLERGKIRTDVQDR